MLTLRGGTITSAPPALGELGDMLDLPLRLAHDARKADVTPLTPEVDGAADTRV